MERHELLEKDRIGQLELEVSEKKILSSKFNLVKVQFRAFVGMAIDIIDHFAVRALQCMNNNYSSDTKQAISQLINLIESKLD